MKQRKKITERKKVAKSLRGMYIQETLFVTQQHTIQILVWF